MAFILNPWDVHKTCMSLKCGYNLQLGVGVEGALAAAGQEDRRSNDGDDDEVSCLLTTYCTLALC